jgi:antiviral defense system Shedu protein SduA
MAMTNRGRFDEESTIGNYWTDTIYPNDFTNGAGKFFNIVAEEQGGTTIEYQPPYPSRNRVKLTVTFLREGGEIKEVTLKKFKQYKSRGVDRWEEQSFGPGEPMTFTHFTFEKLLGFLKLLTELDLANLNERRIALRETTGEAIDPETLAKMQSLLSQPDGLAMVEELLRNGSITSRDLVNIGYRKNQLEVFSSLLSDPERIASYCVEHRITTTQQEKAWQHFFKKNEWIFGYGLDYRFLSILQREAHIAAEDVAGRDGSIADFLLGATNFTVLVEVKKPSTRLFDERRNRAGSWKLSAELIDAVSQILEQKASWQVKAEVNALGNFDDEGNLIAQKTIDPKSILIVGSNSQFSGTEKERAIKLRTFELFRRDSRNLEILTYDELYERAKFVVGRDDGRP